MCWLAGLRLKIRRLLRITHIKMYTPTHDVHVHTYIYGYIHIDENVFA